MCICGVKAGNAEIYFTHDVALLKSIKKNNLHPEIFISVENAETLFMNHVMNNAEIVEPMFDRAWGARQYVIKEINGYYLKFAQPYKLINKNFCLQLSVKFVDTILRFLQDV